MWSQWVWLSRIVAVMGAEPRDIIAAPSARAPVPQSRMKVAPAFVVTSTHEVLPPNRTVPGPGVAIDPRVPQKRTRTRPPVLPTDILREDRFHESPRAPERSLRESQRRLQIGRAHV